MDLFLLILPLVAMAVCCVCCCVSGVFAIGIDPLTAMLGLGGTVTQSTPKPKSGKKKGGTGKHKTTPIVAGSLVPEQIGYSIPEGIKTDCPPNKRGVIGYQHPQRTGRSFMWCATDLGAKTNPSGGIHEIGNDGLSYLSVPEGMKATIYQNHNLDSGYVKVFEKGEYDLHIMKFDDGYQLYDKASSLKIEGTPPDATANTGTYENQNR